MIIYMCGVHGVGKTFLCKKLYSQYGIPFYTASDLIKNVGDVQFNKSKQVSTLGLNEDYLTKAIAQIQLSIGNKKGYVLDGHLCLIDDLGKVTRLKYETVSKINPDYIVLLTEDIKIIANRRMERDGYQQSIREVESLQHAEAEYAKELSMNLHIPLMVSNGMHEIETISKKIVEIFYNY